MLKTSKKKKQLNCLFLWPIANIHGAGSTDRGIVFVPTFFSSVQHTLIEVDTNSPSQATTWASGFLSVSKPIILEGCHRSQQKETYKARLEESFYKSQKMLGDWKSFAVKLFRHRYPVLVSSAFCCWQKKSMKLHSKEKVCAILITSSCPFLNVMLYIADRNNPYKSILIDLKVKMGPPPKLSVVCHHGDWQKGRLGRTHLQKWSRRTIQ